MFEGGNLDWDRAEGMGWLELCGHFPAADVDTKIGLGDSDDSRIKTCTHAQVNLTGRNTSKGPQENNGQVGHDDPKTQNESDP